MNDSVDSKPGGPVFSAKPVGGDPDASRAMPAVSGLITRSIVALSFSGLLAGCAGFDAMLNASGYVSKSAVVLDVPFEKQGSEYLCGLAAADMVGRYYRIPLTEAQHERLDHEATVGGGITAGTLKRVFQQDGYNALLFSGSLDHEVTGVYRHIDRRRPLVVLFARKKGEPGHYVVVVGYDPARHTLIILDPDRGRRVQSERRFRREWEGSSRLTLLAVPPELKPGSTGARPVQAN